MRYIGGLCLASACALLAACGGGSSGGGSISTPPPPAPAPSPAPSPAPTPAPTPTPEPPPYTPPPVERPAPPYSLAPTTTGTLVEAMKSPQDFRTGSTTVEWDRVEGTLMTINRTYGPDEGLRFFSTPDDGGTYTVYNASGGGYSYDLNLWESEATGWSRNSINGVRALTFRVPEYQDPRNPDLWLSYVSSGYWYYRSFDASVGFNPLHSETHFYFGIPTALADLPRLGGASFEGVARGKLYGVDDEYQLSGSATLTADFAAGSFATRMMLKGQSEVVGGTVDLGWFDGSGGIAADTNGFRGEWTGSSLGYEGSILGAFFGPNAEEFGYSFGINNPEFTSLGGGVVIGGLPGRAPPPPPPPGPPPPPPMPPAPPPPPAGSTFPLTTAATFDTITVELTHSGMRNDGDFSIDRAQTAGLSDRLTVSIIPHPEGGTYTVRDGALSATFGVEDLTRRQDPGVKEVWHSVGTEPGRQRSLAIFNNIIPEIGTNDPELQLHYLSYGTWRSPTTTPRQSTVVYFLFGDQTLASDMPRSGSATYSLALSGYRQESIFPFIGEGALTANFGAGTITNQFTLYDIHMGNHLVRMDDFRGTGSIVDGGPFYAGALSGQRSEFAGDFQGAFFGPNAAETGFTFLMSRTHLNDPDFPEHIIGVAVGAKQ